MTRYLVKNQTRICAECFRADDVIKEFPKCSESNYANENLWNEHVSAAGASDASADSLHGAQCYVHSRKGIV